MIEVIASKTFEKQFLKLDKDTRKSVFEKINSFAKGESNIDLKKLQPKELEKYRIRVGRYRVVFEYINSYAVKLLFVDSRDSIYDRF